jgi:hypothetical protein
MPLITPENNPFTILYNGCWELFDTNPKLAEWIPEGNRIKYDKSVDPKSNISNADTPELELLTESTVGIIGINSSSTQVTKNFAWVLVSGDYAINDIYHQLSWEIIRVMSSWDTVLCRLQWNNYSFVHKLEMLNSTEGTALETENKHIRGWAFIWPFEVEMHFLTNDLRTQ